MYSLILLTQIHLSSPTNSHLCEVLPDCYMVLPTVLKLKPYNIANFVTLLQTATRQWFLNKWCFSELKLIINQVNADS